MSENIQIRRTTLARIIHASSFLVSAAILLFMPQALAGSARLTVDAGATGTPVAPTLHGLFFEDINYGADGGLYAELVQNRSFEHREPLYAWSVVARAGAQGRVAVESEAPMNANNLHFLRIYTTKAGADGYGVANSGFDGIPVRTGNRYLFSVRARVRAGKSNRLRVALEDGAGRVLAQQEFTGLTPAWQKFDATFTSPETAKNARLVLLAVDEGVMDVDMVSLFPADTFKNRPNGLRADLAQLLADMKPGFLRFPGGCIVEGKDCANSYRWKDTIGDVAERRQNWNLWQDGQSPEYSQTYGLGFFEYFQFCEDIGAEPVPVINCGMSCQARQGTHVPLNELGPWVQDALDLIEFANGPVTSPWGARRAQLGHSQPFHLKFLAVGNEQWHQEYFDRYRIFYDALKAQHPEIQLISSSGPFAGDELWKFAWSKFRSGTPAQIVDEHYYVPPAWLLENVDRYADYDRRGPKIFVGEFAAHDGRARRNNLRAALAEAAYLTGLLRQSDEVIMASYAPLFGKYGHAQWHPNLIWFDNTRVVPTPSYHVQSLFAQNRPDVVLPVKLEAPCQTENTTGMIGVGTWNTQAEYRDIQVTSPGGQVLYQSDFSRGMAGWKTTGGEWAAVEGALRQTGGGTDLRAVTGDPSWTDYTLTLRARKLGGDEGFLILFHTTDVENPRWWNIGGWRNTAHALQGGELAEKRVPGMIETNRWYDIRIELAGHSVKAFLDGKLINADELKPISTLYCAAGRDQQAKEVVLQIVNASNEAQDTEVVLNGVKKLAGPAKGIILTSADPADENSLESPAKVSPKIISFTAAEPRFQHTFPGNSLTVLRLRTD